MNDSNWRDKYGDWALVTGASSGIGADFCRRLGGKGLNIVLVARREKRLSALAQEIQDREGVKVLIIPQDLTSSGAAENIWNAVGDREIGLLVNNAGFGMFGEFHRLDSHRQAHMVYLNCVIPVILTQLFLPPMVERGKGGLIFLASTAAYQATPYFSVYGATKGFNLLLGEGLWGEYHDRGVDILALSPGDTGTELQRVAGTGRSYGEGAAKSGDVVALALRSLGKKPSVIHGRWNRLLIILQRLTPRRMVLKIAGTWMKRMRAPVQPVSAQGREGAGRPNE